MTINGESSTPSALQIARRDLAYWQRRNAEVRQQLDVIRAGIQQAKMAIDKHKAKTKPPQKIREIVTRRAKRDAN